MGFLEDVYDKIYVEKFGYNTDEEYSKEIKKRDSLYEDLWDYQIEDLEQYIAITSKIADIELDRMFIFAFREGFMAAIDIIEKGDDKIE